MLRNKLEVLRWGVVTPPPNPQAGGPPPVGCPRLLIQYIRSHPPYVRTRRAVVTGDPDLTLVHALFNDTFLTEEAV
jgi:hypothetical protein